MTLSSDSPPAALWTSAPRSPTLTSNDVHVWLAVLERPPMEVERFRESLAPEERQRADRYRFARERERFIVAHGVLRAVLAGYLGVPPERLAFGTGPHGKPLLAGGRAAAALSFNLSHSDGLALYAVSRERAVGIDLERIRLDVAHDQIAQQYFSPRENAALRVLPARLRLRAFFDYWTCKEAYAKARGDGLSLPLEAFDIVLGLDPSAARLRILDDPRESAHWSLQRLKADGDYSAAIAVEGQGRNLTCFRWAQGELAHPGEDRHDDVRRR